MLKAFLCESEYVDFSADIIKQANLLYSPSKSLSDYAEKAFVFVRDEISHAFDGKAQIVTAKASDVWRHRVGICHAKSALLAALLRCKGIPAGFRFQKLTLADDASQGYCIHGYCAVFLNATWLELDPRGNKAGINAQFCVGTPKLAYSPRTEYGEFTYSGIYSQPHLETMRLLDAAPNMEYVYHHMPDAVSQTPSGHM